ncbi:transcriptional repressor [Uliginosibacterium sp. H3]|uniref:Transcriptional repressor n=1 Tax=Uliginosibacterium silvisoli TaxID=3114758 RepID=A0ABU6K1T0_9RHOO|nr:transcriptional repressor [Uliginosibacterium sp. H3]
MSADDLTPADRIRALGARATPARVAVMRLLDAAERALTHHDIELALEGSGFDRVTLYRVLDWMVESGIAHRVTDAQRVFRFSKAATDAPAHDRHAHFRCEDCGKVFCLDDVPVTRPALPKGFSSSAVELSITGHCGHCGKHS